jgi:hypothetical protein
MDAANFACSSLAGLNFTDCIRDIPAQERTHGTYYVFPVGQDSSTDMFSVVDPIQVDLDLSISRFQWFQSVSVPVFSPRSKSSSPFILRSEFRIILPVVRSSGPWTFFHIR